MSSKQKNHNPRPFQLRRFLPTAYCLLPTLLSLLVAHYSLLTVARAQTVIDKTVATITNGSQSELRGITFRGDSEKIVLVEGTARTQPTTAQ